MTIKRETLEAAASAGVLKYSQIDNLLVFLVREELRRTKNSSPGRFYGALLYCLAGVLAVGAAVAFAALAVNALGMGALLWFAVLYGLCAFGLAQWCALRELDLAATLFSVLALVLIAAAIFALQALQGRWVGGLQLLPGFDARWIEIECAVLAASVGLLVWLRQPIMLLPAAFMAWLIGMDLVPAMIGESNTLAALGLASKEELRKAFTLVLGLALVMVGLFIDLRRAADGRLAFWTYFSGLLAFCAAVPLLLSNELPGKLLYLLVHVALMMVGAVLGRRIFEVFGGLGITLVLADMVWEIFRDGLAVVSAMTMLTLLLLGLGLWFWRREPALSARLRGWLPADMQEWLRTRTA